MNQLGREGAYMSFDLVALAACNITFLALVAYVVKLGISDKFVTYFLFGEYLVAMVPLTIIAILEPNTTIPIVAVFLIHIVLLIILGVAPKLLRAN
jgi:hypothetical protein